MTPEVEQMVALDWAEDLDEFPNWAIDQAARTWRRTKKWRPSIAEMRALCKEACAQERLIVEWLRAIVRASSVTQQQDSQSVLQLAGSMVRRIP